MADTTFVMLGTRAAGKSCYLAALYYLLSGGHNSFSLDCISDNADTRRMELVQQLIKMQNKHETNMERLPTGTDLATRIDYEFMLNYGAEGLMGFSIMDYGGEIFTLGGKHLQELKNELGTAHGLFIFIDGDFFCNSDLDEVKDTVKGNCANLIQPFVNIFAKQRKDYPIYFVVTKGDKLPTYDITIAKVVSIIHEEFSAALAGACHAYCCTVQLGACETENWRLKPTGFEYPILHALQFNFQKRLDDGQENYKKYRARISQIPLEIRDFEQKIVECNASIKAYNESISTRNSWITQENNNHPFFPSKRKINGWNSEIDDFKSKISNMNSTIANYKQQINDRNNALPQYQRLVRQYNTDLNNNGRLQSYVATDILLPLER